MKLNCTTLIFLFPAMLFGQGKFERKIVIEDSNFYAIEIIGQTGVLWKGKIDQPMDSAKRLDIPVGTKRRSQHFLPLAWDYFHDTIYAINFTEYAQNERMTSLKSIPINSLHNYDPVNYKTMLNEAALTNAHIENYPLVQTIKKYVYIDDMFFDVIKTENALTEFISVKNEMTIWSWQENAWHTSEIIPFIAPEFFVAAHAGRRIMVYDNSGMQYYYSGNLQSTGKKIPLSTETLIIENRDQEMIQVIHNNTIPDTHVSMQQYIQQNIISN